MKTKHPSPLYIVKTTLAQCPPHFQTAFDNASDCFNGPIPGNTSVRVETYKVSDIIKMYKKWAKDLGEKSSCLDYSKMEFGDKHRIKKIMRLIISGKPQYPYISYWANNMKELWEDADNHGDGWHRTIAFRELGIKTMQLVFEN